MFGIYIFFIIFVLNKVCSVNLNADILTNICNVISAVSSLVAAIVAVYTCLKIYKKTIKKIGFLNFIYIE